MKSNIFCGDSLEVLKQFPDNHFDAVVTDPPYGLGQEPDAVAMLADWVEKGHHDVKSKRGFMGQEWDAFVPQPILWAEVLRVLKPGGHLVAFAGTRTQDLMCLSLRLAGFEIRDLVAWVYSQGFPKSLDVSKAIDKHFGADRLVVGRSQQGSATGSIVTTGTGSLNREFEITAPCTPAAQEWEGWGTALKPALEPITLARKPLDSTVAANVLKWRTGGLNIDGCRIESGPRSGWTNQDIRGGQYASNPDRPRLPAKEAPAGRWPANLIHDGSDEVVSLFPQTGAGHHPKSKTVGFGEFGGGASTYEGPGPKTDKGSAARFFYCAKASKKDRNEGLDDFDVVPSQLNSGGIGRECSVEKRLQEHGENAASRKNPHPTVKPTALMSYLCRLITPPGGLILDPFMGSGSTGKAAVQEGFDFVGIDLSEEFCRIAEARIAAVDPIFAVAAE